MQLPIALDQFAHFSCNGCTHCCDQPWATQIEADKARALDAHDFSQYPQLAGKKFYHAPSDGRKGVFDLAKGRGTRCLFLHADGRCIIHAEMGPQAKPGMCLHFPYLPSATPIEQRVSLNFGCPSVQKSKGAPLTKQQAEIAAVVPPVRRAPQTTVPIAFRGKSTLGQDEHDALMDRASRIFSPNVEGDIWSRFARLLAMLFAIDHQKSSATPEIDSSLADLLRSEADLPNTTATPPIEAFDQPSAAPTPVRMLFAATLFPDTVSADSAARPGLLARLTLVPRLMSLARLSGGYASRVLGRNVSIDAVLRHEVDATLDAGASDLLLRYFRARFWQRMLAGGRLPVVAGFHQHIHDFNAIIFFARAELLASDGQRLTDELIRAALQKVEFHIANQPRLYEQIFRGWLRAQLSDIPLALSSLRLMALRQPSAVRSSSPLPSSDGHS